MTQTAPIRPDRVSIRMYKGILGDCLALILEKKGRPTTRLLIDCGVLQGTKGADKLMNDRVEHLLSETGDQGLDLVVVTHEHHDHISGFNFAKDQFASKPPGKVWFAWTEDPHDPDGIEFQRRFGEGFAILGALGAKLKVTPHDDKTATGDPLGLTGFSGVLPVQDKQTGKVTERGSRAIYKNLSEWAGPGNTAFLSPGMVIDTPGALALRTYVLGPPRDARMMAKTVPSGSEKTVQEYFAMADDGTAEQAQARSPFIASYRWRSLQQISKAVPKQFDRVERLSPQALTALRYWGQKRPDLGFDPDEPNRHRRIEDNSQTMFSNLSIKMDNKTNNSSLVLAFELPDDHGILLFAADAQAGNWLSWKDVVFREAPDAPPLKLTAADLLSRTCFYKVGHHGSHNATMKRDGLEQMNRPDLVAMVPTDAEVAKQQPAHWLMPNPNVESALLDHGLVLRGDRDLKSAITDRTDRPGALAEDKLTEWAKGRVKEDPLCVEYLVYDRERDR